MEDWRVEAESLLCGRGLLGLRILDFCLGCWKEFLGIGWVCSSFGLDALEGRDERRL